MIVFLKGILKLTIAISLALIATAAVIFGGYKLLGDREESRRKADAAPYEQVSRHQVDLKKPLDLAFTVETKVVDGYLYVSIRADGYPKYLLHPKNKASGAFILNFYDSDGFNVYEKSISIKDFTTVVNGSDPDGLSYQFKEFVSLSDYKRFSRTSIGWTVDEKLVPTTAQPSPPIPSKPTATLPDPCAPGLSKSERLRRLAALGDVKQSSADSYSAGGRRVAFSGDYLLSCF